jgi:hypothetical protein
MVPLVLRQPSTSITAVLQSSQDYMDKVRVDANMTHCAYKYDFSLNIAAVGLQSSETTT